MAENIMAKAGKVRKKGPGEINRIVDNAHRKTLDAPHKGSRVTNDLDNLSGFLNAIKKAR